MIIENVNDDLQEASDKKELLLKLRSDIGLFGRLCFPTALNKATPPFHHEIYKAIKDESIPRVLIAAPRGNAKSTVISLIYPLWKAAFKPTDGEEFIVIVSESQAQSINFLSRIKYHLDNSTMFHELFGNLGSATASR